MKGTIKLYLGGACVSKRRYCDKKHRNRIIKEWLATYAEIEVGFLPDDEPNDYVYGTPTYFFTPIKI